MAGRKTSADGDAMAKAAAAEPRPVTVVSPDGEFEEEVTDPTYLNNVVSGLGYRVKDMSTAEASALLSDPAATTEAGD